MIPLHWPLPMAVPDKFGVGWIVNPLLAVGILIFTARIARPLGGPAVAFGAVLILVLSPCFLAPTVVLMSHALAGLLVAAACWAWQEGMRRRTLAPFLLMYFLSGSAVTCGRLRHFCARATHSTGVSATV